MMANTFVQTVEPYILSDDKVLRDFALRSLNDAYLATERTFFYALQALDKLEPDPMINPIIPFTNHIPVTENILKEVITRLNRNDDNFHWYSIIISRCDSELIAKYQDELAPFINKKTLDTIASLQWLNTEQLYIEVADILKSLKTDATNQSLFHFGKRIFKELTKREEYDEPNFDKIEAVIKEEMDKDFFTYQGIYHVFLAGEQKVSSLIPQLTDLLSRDEEDILLEEVKESLIKIGTPEVVPAVEKYVINEFSSFFAVDVLENIKHPSAEEMLLYHLDQTTDKGLKTLIANALCRQLSTKAIPKVVALIEEGYDESILDLKEPLYANCVLNNVDYPNLEQKEKARQKANRLKIGRNDPCPCGSGKKFKKCCWK